MLTILFLARVGMIHIDINVQYKYSISQYMYSIVTFNLIFNNYNTSANSNGKGYTIGEVPRSHYSTILPES